MPTQPWIYAVNPFTIATKGSYAKANQIAFDLMTSLEAASTDPDILSMYNYYQPLYAIFESAYTNWHAKEGFKLSATQELQRLLKGITPELNDWDYDIRGVYKKETEGYIKLMNGGHKPFLQGGSLFRVMRVRQLADALLSEPALAATQAAVDAYATQLETARANKDENKSAFNILSSQVEQERLNICTAMYKIMGKLIDKYADMPERVALFFDLQAIRQHKQTLFTGHVKAKQIKAIAKRTLQATDQILLKNTGNATLRFYFSERKAKPEQSIDVIDLLPKTQRLITAADAGHLKNAKWFCVRNLNETFEGAWEVKMG